MVIIKPARIHAYAIGFPIAASSVLHWLSVTKIAQWKSFQDVKDTFNTADAVPVESGRTVVVFNIAGKKFRLITAIHYNLKKVFVLRFLTHAEYNKGKWKEEL